MNRTFKPNRQGITLLFVISMIVLFLLMGTAFVIVANNFNRDSTSRIRANVPEGKGSQLSNQLIEEAMRQIIRGTDLRDISSPLRTNDMLSDQYGYGFKSFVSDADVAPRPAGGGAFVEIAIRAVLTDANTEGHALDLLTRSTTPEDLAVDLDSDGQRELISDLYSGQVLSFTSGAAKGFSARIYSDYFDPDENDVHIFRIPADSISGDTITTAMLADLAESEIIINGRDFSGVGAGVVLDGTGNPTLGGQALLPNRVGQPHADLVALGGAGSGASYLSTTDSGTAKPNILSVNEPWDAADVSTMFLSGFDKFGNIIASFHRQSLLDNVPEGNNTVAAGRTFFHAFDEFDSADPLDRAGIPDVDADGDGVKDSFWMDLGLSIITNREGKRFKPLFAILVKDMEGRVNTNAHGNRTHADADGYVSNSQTFAGGAAQTNTARGGGMGVAEIDLSRTLNLDTNALNELLDARYGDGGIPGDGTSFRSRAKLFGYPMNVINPEGEEGTGTVGRLFSTAMDINGRFQIGSPQSGDSGFDTFLDLNYPNFNTGLPQINMLASGDIPGFDNEFTGNAYEMSLSGLTSSDRPFTPEELERVLRPNDIDSSLLPNRLSSIVGNVGRNLATSHSFDVPMLYQNFTIEMLRDIQTRNPMLGGAGLTNEERLVLYANWVIQASTVDGQFAFAPELFRGLKMDINRPFGDGVDNNDNDVFDEPGEVLGQNLDAAGLLDDEINLDLNYGSVRPNSGGNDADPRAIFARQLYMLAMLKLAPVDIFQDGDPPTDGTFDPETDPERLAFAKAMAQWAVNVVDFRDPDSIHTRFVYDPFPFDAQGWNPTVDGDGVPVAPGGAVVWGAERPELLLTETLAVHIQNMERNDEGTYEQRLRPEPFAYFEVYNPWTQNRLNQHTDESLYTRFGLDLARKDDEDNESPVWRFEIERAEPRAAGAEDHVRTKFTPLRYIYMTDPGDKITYDDASEDQVQGDIEIFYSSGGRTLLRPGRQAVIGTQGFKDGDEFQVFMGRKTNADDAMGASANMLMLDETTRLAITPSQGPNTGTIKRYTGSGDAEEREAITVFIDKSKTVTGTVMDRKFSLSDPYEGYPTGTEIPDGDGFVYNPARPSTLDVEDGERLNQADIAMIRSKDGINKNFRYVRLQRLANPLLKFDAVTNPYLTIDSMEVDLVSINGADVENPDPSLQDATGGTQAVSHEKGNAARGLWGFQRDATIRDPEGVDASTDHNYALAFDESLGQTNDLFEPENASNTLPFAWLTWNNRPFISHTEIMNVPYLAPEELTYAVEAAVDPSRRTPPFTIDDGTIEDPYATGDDSMATRPGALAGRYGHLLNFFAGEDVSSDAVLDAYKLLDFIEVPSRFVGTESYYTGGGADVLAHPFNTISNFRDPGLININTIPPSTGTTSTVWNALISEQVRGQFGWPKLKNSLYGEYATRDANTNPTDFGNPFRPSAVANLVPGINDRITGAGCTLMRPVSNE